MLKICFFRVTCSWALWRFGFWFLDLKFHSSPLQSLALGGWSDVFCQVIFLLSSVRLSSWALWNQRLLLYLLVSYWVSIGIGDQSFCSIEGISLSAFCKSRTERQKEDHLLLFSRKKNMHRFLSHPRLFCFWVFAFSWTENFVYYTGLGNLSFISKTSSRSIHIRS